MEDCALEMSHLVNDENVVVDYTPEGCWRDWR